MSDGSAFDTQKRCWSLSLGSCWPWSHSVQKSVCVISASPGKIPFQIFSRTRSMDWGIPAVQWRLFGEGNKEPETMKQCHCHNRVCSVCIDSGDLSPGQKRKSFVREWRKERSSHWLIEVCKWKKGYRSSPTETQLTESHFGDRAQCVSKAFFARAFNRNAFSTWQKKKKNIKSALPQRTARSITKRVQT